MKKSNYDGVIGWVKYMIDYPYNKIDLELLDGERKENQKERQRLNKKINNEVINRKIIEQEKDNLMELLNKRIDVISNELARIKKRNNELRSVVEKQYQQITNLEEQVKEKESARRKNASAIGGLKAQNNLLEDNRKYLNKQLEKANKIIEYYRKSKKPNIEEIKAYELGHREVEKRQKQK